MDRMPERWTQGYVTGYDTIFVVVLAKDGYLHVVGLEEDVSKLIKPERFKPAPWLRKFCPCDPSHNN